MKTLQERYLFLLHKKDVTAYEVAKKTGVSDSVFSTLKLGKTSSLSNNNAKRLADYFGVTKEWLVTGKGEMYISQNVGDNSNNNNCNSNNVNSPINGAKEFAKVSENFQQLLLNKDEQIREKDKQISDLLAIIKDLTKK